MGEGVSIGTDYLSQTPVVTVYRLWSLKIWFKLVQIQLKNTAQSLQVQRSN